MTVMKLSGRMLLGAAALMLMAGNTLLSAQDTPQKGYVRPANAKDKFEAPSMPGVKGEPAKTEKDVKDLISQADPKKPKAESKMSGARTRGNDSRNQCGVGDYKGLCGMWQFTNHDFPSTGNTCGQAAAATIITHWEKARNDANFKRTLASFLYSNYGPNNALGLLGTSWQQVVNSVTIPYKMSWRKVSGESDLRTELAKGVPVIVMIDSERLRQRGYSYLPSPVGISGHWVVVYGYDSGFYYVTNHPNNWISRKDFLESWNTWIHGGFDGGNRGYVFWK
jgi:hypothetical protein